MKVSQLLEEVKGASLTGGDAQICGLCADSRVVGKGDLFFCLSGTQVDAHAYARSCRTYARRWRASPPFFTDTLSVK